MIVLLNGRGGDAETGTNSAVGGDKSRPLPVFCSDDFSFSVTKSTILLINVSSEAPAPIRSDFLFDSIFLRLLSLTRLGPAYSVEEESSESDFSTSFPVPLISKRRN